jgi:hypothetical protein
MRTLIYKRTHEGDPGPQTGVFGNHDCMGTVRGWRFDAVIGIGGIRPWPECKGIARRLTWVGIGPHKIGEPSRPRVMFDHFRYYRNGGPLLKEKAPALARRMYDKNVRVITSCSLSSEERLDVERILGLARNAPPSLAVWLGAENAHFCRRTACMPNEARTMIEVFRVPITGATSPLLA